MSFVAKANKKQRYFLTVNQDMIDSILDDIANGGTIKHSALANCLSEKHFYNLVNQGIVDIETGLHDTLEARLVQSLNEIELNEVTSCRKDIRSAHKGHKGAEWTLEHVYWRHFGNHAEVKALHDELERLKQTLNGVNNVNANNNST